MIRMIKVKFKKTAENAVVPTKAHWNDAAYDLVATSMRYDDNGNIIYGTGLAMEIPNGYAGYVYPRSSVRKKNLMMANSVGVIDAGYRGEIEVSFKRKDLGLTWWSGLKLMLGFKKLVHLMDDSKVYGVGDRVAQLVIRTAPKVEWIETSELSDSERGSGGHGSTGK